MMTEPTVSAPDQEVVRVLDRGAGEFPRPDPDAFRRHVRTNKQRAMVSKVVDEQEAIARFVQDGDYLAYDCNMARRGPAALVREIIRQRKRNLWVAGKFTGNDVSLLVAGGCVSRVDVGWMEIGRPLREALDAGDVEFTEWTNGAMTYRLLAGAMGVPFLPLRYVGGTDVFRMSGAKLIENPYGGAPVCLVPALNPDVAVLHAHECDEFGNARIYGPGVAPLETAMASKRVIISTERIISDEDIRRDPRKTLIPYYMVDAVVHVPFGSYLGSMPGVYRADVEHMVELGQLTMTGRVGEYLEKYVYGVATHAEMLEKHVGATRLVDLTQGETLHEGYD